jgi:hypothetical protein
MIKSKADVRREVQRQYPDLIPHVLKIEVFNSILSDVQVFKANLDHIRQQVMLSEALSCIDRGEDANYLKSFRKL